MQKGPSYSSSAARKPEKSVSARSRYSVSVRRAAFFPPGLDPVLDRGVGDEHAVIAPEAPTGRAIGEAVFDDQADGGVDDTPRIVTARVGQVGHVGVEVLATAGAVVLRVENDRVAWPSGEGIAQVMKGPSPLAIAIGTVAAARAGPAAVIAALAADLGLGQILDVTDPLGGIGAVFAGSWHGVPPLLEGRVLPGSTPGDGDLFTDPARFPCYRLGFR